MTSTRAEAAAEGRRAMRTLAVAGTTGTRINRGKGARPPHSITLVRRRRGPVATDPGWSRPCSRLIEDSPGHRVRVESIGAIVGAKVARAAVRAVRLVPPDRSPYRPPAPADLNGLAGNAEIEDRVDSTGRATEPWWQEQPARIEAGGSESGGFVRKGSDSDPAQRPPKSRNNPPRRGGWPFGLLPANNCGRPAS